MTLYHTSCPQCRFVEALLKQKNIKYKECTDTEEILKLGFKQVPVLEDNSKYYCGSKEILNYINSMEK